MYAIRSYYEIVAAGVGAVETYAKMLEDYQRETTLNMMTLGSYGLIKGGYGFYSSAYANLIVKMDIVLSVHGQRIVIVVLQGPSEIV